MRDGPWWKQQWLVVSLQDPLIPLHKWSCLSSRSDTLAVMVDGFHAHQQLIVCRLLGDEVYEREVAPKLREVRIVRRDAAVHREKVRGMAAVGLILGRNAYTVEDHTTYNVYPRLTPAFFLAQHLPEPCRRYILNDSVYIEFDYPDDGTAYNEPYCQWLLGCWDAVLLPKCAQWIGRGSVHLNMVRGLPHSYQTACLIHARSCMSGVTQLSLRGGTRDWTNRMTLTHPTPLAVSELTDKLPSLASLHIRGMPLYREMIDSLMTDSQLQHLWLDDTPLYGLGPDEFEWDVGAALSFSYPSCWPDAVLFERAESG